MDFDQLGKKKKNDVSSYQLPTQANSLLPTKVIYH